MDSVEGVRGRCFAARVFKALCNGVGCNLGEAALYDVWEGVQEIVEGHAPAAALCWDEAEDACDKGQAARDEYEEVAAEQGDGASARRAVHKLARRHRRRRLRRGRGHLGHALVCARVFVCVFCVFKLVSIFFMRNQTLHTHTHKPRGDYGR